MHDQCKTSAKLVQDQCKTSARPVQDQCKTNARPVQDQCKTSARPVQDQCETSARPVHDQCTTRKTSATQRKRTHEEVLLLYTCFRGYISQGMPKYGMGTLTPGNQAWTVLNTSMKNNSIPGHRLNWMHAFLMLHRSPPHSSGCVSIQDLMSWTIFVDPSGHAAPNCRGQISISYHQF